MALLEKNKVREQSYGGYYNKFNQPTGVYAKNNLRIPHDHIKERTITISNTYFGTTYEIPAPPPSFLAKMLAQITGSRIFRNCNFVVFFNSGSSRREESDTKFRIIAVIITGIGLIALAAWEGLHLSGFLKQKIAIYF